MKQRKKGGTKPPMTMKAVMFVMEEELHTKLKMAAAETKVTLKAYVIEAIRQAVEKGGNKKN